MLKRHLPAWSLLLALLFPVLPGVADEEEERPSHIGGLVFVDELDYTVVNIAAYVTDHKGNPITGLAKDDFRLEQDGREREITNFQAYTEESNRIEDTPALLDIPPKAPSEPSQPTALQPQPAFLAIYVDNENLEPLDRNQVLRDVRRFIRTNLRPPAKVMVASFRRSIQVEQPFTSDPDLVIEALDSLRTSAGGRSERVTTRNEIQDNMLQLIEEEGIPQGYGAARGGWVYREVFNDVDAYASEEANILTFSLEGLRDMIALLSGLPGRKSILYISNGLPMVPGAELFTAFSRTFEDQSILNNLTRYDRTRYFDALVSTANSQDITLYTIGAGGLELAGLSTAEYASPRDPFAAELGEDTYIDSLRYMANGTGGLAIVNTNDFSGGLERIQKDINTYYSLGYSLNRTGGDKVHHIEITLPNHPEYTLRYRRRFVEKGLETQIQDRVMSGLFFDLDENPMELEVSVGRPSPAAQGHFLVPIRITFPLEKIALLPASEDDLVGRLVVYLAARDKEGRKSDLVRRSHEVWVEASKYEDARRKRFHFEAELLMTPGSHRLVVGLLDETVRQVSYQTIQTVIDAPQ